jgi:hypothetical protein
VKTIDYAVYSARAIREIERLCMAVRSEKDGKRRDMLLAEINDCVAALREPNNLVRIKRQTSNAFLSERLDFCAGA